MLRIASNASLSATSTASSSPSSTSSISSSSSNVFSPSRFIKADRDQVLKHSSSFSCTRRFDPSNIQKRVLEWCQAQTKSYKNVKITNFSSSWADGLAFCALIHSFLPDAFDYDKLNGTNRRQNFELAFETANQRANIAPLLEVSDMINMGNKPDDKCVYTYVSTIFTRFQKLRPRLYQSTQQQQLQQIQQQHLVNEQAIKRQ